ncbi:alkylhydroperoxidase domain protein [Corynebacterium aurimucosum]|uniref:alkylhydroperoxidase domain protein n=1 Tax=Corynebacterium aurimucosum TaxID=169292 RepID=UPI0006690BEB|nr:alkylhydroperoxidase domain protein [Corynebacterium aurimucosum]
MADIINLLAGVEGDVAQLRERRPEAKENAQASFAALLEPAEPGTFSYAERYAIATFVAGVYQAAPAVAFYSDLLAEESEGLAAEIARAVKRGITTGPYSDGGFTLFEGSPRLAAALDFAHLLVFHPKDASPAAIGHLQAAGWSNDDIVTLAQLISFLSFQLRVVHGLSVLAGTAQPTPVTEAPRPTQTPEWVPGEGTLVPDVAKPQGFVAHSLGWKPWVPPQPKEEFTDAQRDALIKPERIDMEYFRLLARDPAALKARTLTDLDIFYNTDGGLGRAERELAATVVSRLNGCEYCASVHQQRAKEEGGDAAAVDRLLEEGVDADLGSEQWSAIRDAALALTESPFAFDASYVERLEAVGFDTLAIIDVINSTAFFNWANRLMLTLGEPDVPKRFR